MKIAIVIHQPNDVINKIYNRSISNDIPYREQIKIISQFGFGWAGVWVEPFRKLGVDVKEFYPTITQLNESWIRENCNNLAANQYEAIACEQIANFKPDVVIVESHTDFTNEFPRHIKEYCIDVKLVYAHICNLWYQEKDFIEYDAVMTCLKSIKTKLDELDINSFILPNAFDTRFVQVRTGHIINRALFIGQVLLSFSKSSPHFTRFIYLLSLNAYRTDIDISIFKRQSIINSVIERLKWLAKGIVLIFRYKSEICSITHLTIISQLKSLFKLTLYSGSLLYGDSYYELVSKYVVVLNVQADICENELANMRIFEVTGMGICLLTNYVADIENYFVVGKELAVYTSPKECSKAISYLLKHPKIANSIANSGRNKTLTKHSYNSRAITILTSVNRMLNKS